MLTPSLPGWKIETVGDDVCWMREGPDGRLWAINPENGLFGGIAGTTSSTNPNAIRALATDVIFTNVALRRDEQAWWEGLPPLRAEERVYDWSGRLTGAADTEPRAHPQARFTVPLRSCPTVRATAEISAGVPISAVLFGGRRSRLMPLVFEARSWRHGVYVGASMVTETLSSSTGALAVSRHDPMGMAGLCGYNMADYFSHWLAVGRQVRRPPKIFHVNWFRTSAQGELLWPGFGENIRVLEWVLACVENRAAKLSSAVGYLPAPGALDLTGLDLPEDAIMELLTIDPKGWLQEARRVSDFLFQFGPRLPLDLVREHRALVHRLNESMQ